MNANYIHEVYIWLFMYELKNTHLCSLFYNVPQIS